MRTSSRTCSRLGFEMRGEIIWNKGVGKSSTAWGSWRSASDPSLRDEHEYILVFSKLPHKRPGGAAKAVHQAVQL